MFGLADLSLSASRKNAVPKTANSHGRAGFLSLRSGHFVRRHCHGNLSSLPKSSISRLDRPPRRLRLGTEPPQATRYAYLVNQFSSLQMTRQDDALNVYLEFSITSIFCFLHLSPRVTQNLSLTMVSYGVQQTLISTSTSLGF